MPGSVQPILAASVSGAEVNPSTSSKKSLHTNAKAQMKPGYSARLPVSGQLAAAAREARSDPRLNHQRSGNSSAASAKISQLGPFAPKQQRTKDNSLLLGKDSKIAKINTPIQASVNLATMSFKKRKPEETEPAQLLKKRKKDLSSLNIPATPKSTLEIQESPVALYITPPTPPLASLSKFPSTKYAQPLLPIQNHLLPSNHGQTNPAVKNKVRKAKVAPDNDIGMKNPISLLSQPILSTTPIITATPLVSTPFHQSQENPGSNLAREIRPLPASSAAGDRIITTLSGLGKCKAAPAKSSPKAKSSAKSTFTTLALHDLPSFKKKRPVPSSSSSTPASITADIPRADKGKGRNGPSSALQQPVHSAPAISSVKQKVDTPFYGPRTSIAPSVADQCAPFQRGFTPAQSSASGAKYRPGQLYSWAYLEPAVEPRLD